MVIERAFALLKGRFRRLQHLEVEVTPKISTVIIAACVLHNLCIFHEDDIDDYMETTHEDNNNYVSLAIPNTQARDKRQQIMQHLNLN